jgi:hypothetical protein
MFEFNFNAKSKIWVVEDFYNDPMAVRNYALNQEYNFEIYYRGRRTQQQFLFPGLKERFEEIMGIKIKKWDDHGMNGRFQHCTVEDALVYHCDDQTWAAVIFLTPEAPFQCGTTLWAHKKYGTRSKYEFATKGYAFEKGFLDKTPLEPVDVMGNVFNRLVIWDASSCHSASEYFGTKKENSRLFQIFFFD